MNSNRPVSELAKLMPEFLQKGETVSFSPQGRSMTPTIKVGDTVTLVACQSPKRLDVLFYTRDDGKAVLHRLIGFDKNGGYIMRGDGQIVKEYGITVKNIIARVDSVTRNGKKRKMSGFAFFITSVFAVFRSDVKCVVDKIQMLLKKRAK